MPTIINLPGRRLFRFALGEPPEPAFEMEAHLRWVLADYPARRDEQWRVPLQNGGVVLTKIYYQAKSEGPDQIITPILAAFGFWGMLVKYARHFARESLPGADEARTIAALLSLGPFTTQDSIPVLEQYLSDPSAAVRRASLVSFAKLARAEDFPRLEGAAQGDPDLEAIVRVGRRRMEFVDAKDMQGFMRETLGHADFYEDLAGLANLMPADLAGLFINEGELDPVSRARCARVLGLARTRVRRAMHVALEIALAPTRESYLRRECILFLGRTRAPLAEDMLPLLAEPDPEIVLSTIIALGEIGDSVAIGPILNHYDDAGGAFRAHIELAAYRMSGALDDAAYNEWAQGQLDLDPHSAYFFFQGSFSTVFSEATFIPLLEHADVLVRREAALLLGLLGSSAVAPELRKLAVREADELTHAVAARAAFLANSRGPRQGP
ncbi:MAG: HEAT repeat domain-containing protein [Myxococcota bacterium]